jgi:hypothetical protein
VLDLEERAIGNYTKATKDLDVAVLDLHLNFRRDTSPWFGIKLWIDVLFALLYFINCANLIDVVRAGCMAALTTYGKDITP